MSRIQNPLPQVIPGRVHRAQQRLQRAIWKKSASLALQIGPLHEDFVPLDTGMNEPMRLLAPGEYFASQAQQWGHCWGRLDIPAATSEEAGRRFLLWDGFGEITVYIDGAPWWGLDWAHKDVPLPDHACTLWLSCGLWHGNGEFGLQYKSAELAVREELAWQCYWDIDALNELLTYYLEKETGVSIQVFRSVGFKSDLQTLSPFLRRLLRALDDAVNIFDEHGMAAFQPALRDIFQHFPAEAWQPAVALSGHAHIDLVWLWPEHVVNQKGLHTFATQLRLLEMYPEFSFSQSQPALYRSVEKLAPEMMTQIARRIAEGRWEATGASEVELDTLVPCGESMARSVLYGQRKFRELRGGDSSRVLWIPDVFGYTACLPQVLALCDVPGFFTTKMTWSTISKFPYTSFVWRGSDGSEVLSHLCTRAYVGQARIPDLIGSLADHRQCDVHPELLYPHGYGDGGGGVTIECLERARRLNNLSGVPRARWSRVEDFYARMETARDRLPVYQGELYLEYHRGTYTTQSEFKRLHRAGERALQIHEAVRVATGGEPLGEADWLRVLFAEFHDALPGSSIRLVYEQMLPELEQLQTRVHQRALTELTVNNTTPVPHVFNPLAISRISIIEHDGTQMALHLPALASIPLSAEHQTALPEFAEVSEDVLDNGLLRATFDANGRLAALVIDGEALLLDAPASFALYYDEPHMFDAWDIDHYTYQFPHPVAAIELKVVEMTPLRAVLCGEAPLGNGSALVVRYLLDAGSRWLRVEAEVEWQEAHQTLRYHLPTDYRGRWARFGNPFGSIQRPQAPGTQADEAMWEVPGNRWAAVLHDDGTGLALVTEAKYGFSCKDGDLGVTLLRSSKEPDPLADMGHHVIRFAIGRHQSTTTGDLATTVLAADLLYTPPVIIPNGAAIEAQFALSDLGSLAPAWVLPETDGEGYIIRLHETNGSTGCARLTLATPPRNVLSVNFLEETLGELPRPAPNEVDIPYRPYQIISVLVQR